MISIQTAIFYVKGEQMPSITDLQTAITQIQTTVTSLKTTPPTQISESVMADLKGINDDLTSILKSAPSSPLPEVPVVAPTVPVLPTPPVVGIPATDPVI